MLQGAVYVGTRVTAKPGSELEPGCHENIQASERVSLKYYGNGRIEVEGRPRSREYRLCSRTTACAMAFAPEKKQFLHFLATSECMQQHLDSVRQAIVHIHFRAYPCSCHAYMVCRCTVCIKLSIKARCSMSALHLDICSLRF